MGGVNPAGLELPVGFVRRKIDSRMWTVWDGCTTSSITYVSGFVPQAIGRTLECVSTRNQTFPLSPKETLPTGLKSVEPGAAQ